MNEKGAQLADKLSAEGDRTVSYLRGLGPDAWSRKIYGDDHALWSVRELFEHLIVSEESLRTIFRRVVEGQPGTPEGFDIDAFNAASTGKLATLTLEQLFERYSDSRARTTEFARGLSNDQLALTGRHPALGMSKVEDMLRLIYMHHTMHLKDVKNALRAP